ncbi:MAG TPA: zinc ABC transporter ATP-binding protein ZnuC [Gammaproteobacteria bacterium]|jgi:zinc transport system ATP-binding protein|nr:zinc ABC transporter ATP-binding protein ZnuC [Gammaproteobacteria bacterium]
MSTLITADNLFVSRRDQVILHDVSLRIGERDFITLIGPNGAGKSMLLKCLLGFYKPDAGRIERADDLRVAYVPQSLKADTTLPITVSRFLTLRQKPARDVLDNAIAETGIESLVAKPLQVLSGGEMQRVLMARALLSEPQLLVMDEPAQNLDISGQLAFYRLVDDVYHRRGLSVLMVSHDLHWVMASTRQVICLYHHVCCTGTPQAVAQDPQFVALFGEDMSKLMAMYRHSHDHNHLHDSASDGCGFPHE